MSEMPISVVWEEGKRKRRTGRMIAKIGGYTGKTETSNPIKDIYDGYMIWFDLEQSKMLPRIGKKVTVIIGGKRFGGKVIGGPGGSRWGSYERRLKKIVLEEKVGNKLSKQRIRALHKKALEALGR